MIIQWVAISYHKPSGHGRYIRRHRGSFRTERFTLQHYDAMYQLFAMMAGGWHV